MATGSSTDEDVVLVSRTFLNQLVAEHEDRANLRNQQLEARIAELERTLADFRGRMLTMTDAVTSLQMKLASPEPLAAIKMECPPMNVKEEPAAETLQVPHIAVQSLKEADSVYTSEQESSHPNSPSLYNSPHPLRLKSASPSECTESSETGKQPVSILDHPDLLPWPEMFKLNFRNTWSDIKTKDRKLMDRMTAEFVKEQTGSDPVFAAPHPGGKTVWACVPKSLESEYIGKRVWVWLTSKVLQSIQIENVPIQASFKEAWEKDRKKKRKASEDPGGTTTKASKPSAAAIEKDRKRTADGDADSADEDSIPLKRLAENNKKRKIIMEADNDSNFTISLSSASSSRMSSPTTIGARTPPDPVRDTFGPQVVAVNMQSLMAAEMPVRGHNRSPNLPFGFLPPKSLGNSAGNSAEAVAATSNEQLPVNGGQGASLDVVMTEADLKNVPKSQPLDGKHGTELGTVSGAGNNLQDASANDKKPMKWTAGVPASEIAQKVMSDDSLPSLPIQTTSTARVEAKPLRGSGLGVFTPFSSLNPQNLPFNVGIRLGGVDKTPPENTPEAEDKPAEGQPLAPIEPPKVVTALELLSMLGKSQTEMVPFAKPDVAEATTSILTTTQAKMPMAMSTTVRSPSPTSSTSSKGNDGVKSSPPPSSELESPTSAISKTSEVLSALLASSTSSSSSDVPPPGQNVKWEEKKETKETRAESLASAALKPVRSESAPNPPIPSRASPPPYERPANPQRPVVHRPEPIRPEPMRLGLPPGADPRSPSPPPRKNGASEKERRPESKHTRTLTPTPPGSNVVVVEKSPESVKSAGKKPIVEATRPPISQVDRIKDSGRDKEPGTGRPRSSSDVGARHSNSTLADKGSGSHHSSGNAVGGRPSIVDPNRKKDVSATSHVRRYSNGPEQRNEDTRGPRDMPTLKSYPLSQPQRQQHQLPLPPQGAPVRKNSRDPRLNDVRDPGRTGSVPPIGGNPPSLPPPPGPTNATQSRDPRLKAQPKAYLSYQSILDVHVQGWQTWIDEPEKERLNADVLKWMQASMTKAQFAAGVEEGRRGIPKEMIEGFLKHFRPHLLRLREKAGGRR
ncbi:hypothetical protein HDU97_001273 [Phlyctochytrium planicorne]|nr:hypothetical protein HDU97_001273 [Phlyctochytrium planicorne]